VITEGRPRDTGRLVCQVEGCDLTFHSDHILPGSTIAKVGDVDTLVIPILVALTFGLS